MALNSVFAAAEARVYAIDRDINLTGMSAGDSLDLAVWALGRVIVGVLALAIEASKDGGQ
jgi:hypothetical protein